MHRSLPSIIALAWIIAVPGIAWSQDFSGKFQSQDTSIQINADPAGQFTGSIQRAGQQFPLKATLQNGLLVGTFNSQGHDFPFTASLRDNHLTLVSQTATLQLDRTAAALNPLATPNNPAPAAAPGASGDGPAGYALLASAGDGRALFINRTDVTAADKALVATLKDFNRFFDANVAILSAYADAKTNRGGGASFTAKLKGQDIRGTVFCGIGDKGAAITVLYDRASAPQSEWQSLLAALTPGVKTTTYNFPDGTGSIDVPEKWKTVNQSCIGGITVNGPDDQIVIIGGALEILTPDSQLIQLHNQLAAQARRMGNPPPPPIAMFIAPYTTPAEALKNLFPQFSQVSQAKGGPAMRLDKIIQTAGAQAGLPNGQAQLIYFAITNTQNGRQTPVRIMSQMETYLVGQGTWGMFVTELAAPDSSFDHDLPLMLQIAHSFKCNGQVVAQITNNTIQQNNQRFAAFECSIKEKNEAFERQMDHWRQQELVQSRSNDDFDEIIRGYRTVEDTQTGQQHDVNLGNSTDIVNHLNASSPGRYKEIPLRDQMDPLPSATH